jgi:hypothetical protein
VSEQADWALAVLNLIVGVVMIAALWITAPRNVK